MVPTKIAIIDGHPIFRDGLIKIFSERADYSVVGAGTCASDIIDIGKSTVPDVILLDTQVPGRVIEAIVSFRKMSHLARILVFTASESVDCAIEALEAGADGYALKESTLDELENAISCVMSGNNYVNPRLATKVIRALHHPVQQTAGEMPVLSIREEQVVALLMKGCTNKNIAAALNIREKTVKHYMTMIMQKLDVSNRLEVVVAAHGYSHREGLNGKHFN
ncbi:possible response regulator in two-component regulatory system [Aurantimonas manganoxydans SI85-9A1]|uniref:Possible response regulator in two-component regulatory system n=1 Tax=Aurantimonas manganoxydans (strain ATCC BAA-1229 / DSM 21871 / SI85-9A1) TaxID=287752 RepID=Q1YMS9_AURMS|nr:response regulator transcription factor [Aurantimonas manganoxydans]EAS51302.1 possible response regulator in two-component regulatory system [Aurantimonas manganoxydans SI85-9A1]